MHNVLSSKSTAALIEPSRRSVPEGTIASPADLPLSAGGRRCKKWSIAVGNFPDSRYRRTSRSMDSTMGAGLTHLHVALSKQVLQTRAKWCEVLPEKAGLQLREQILHEKERLDLVRIQPKPG